MVYAPKTGIKLPGTSGNYISTPDHSSLDITGNLCLIAKISIIDVSTGSTAGLISKWETSGGQRSFVFQFRPTGEIQVAFSTDGTPANSYGYVSALSWDNYIIDTTIPHYAAVTIDVSTDLVYFWYSFNYLNWVLLDFGTPTNATGLSSFGIFAGTSNLELGASDSGTSVSLDGTIYSAQIYDGIGDNSQPGLGTLVAEFNAAKCKPRYRDSTGKIWTLNGSNSTMEKV